MTGDPGALNGVIAVLGCFGLAAVIIVGANAICGRKPFDMARDDDRVLDEPLTAPGFNRPAYRPLPRRKTWVDEQGDRYTTAPVAEVEPPRTCPPDDDHSGAPVRLADRRAVHVADVGLFAFLAGDMPENHKVADMFDLYCTEAEDRS